MQYAQEVIVRGTNTKEQNLVLGEASVGEISHTSAPP